MCASSRENGRKNVAAAGTFNMQPPACVCLLFFLFIFGKRIESNYEHKQLAKQKTGKLENIIVILEVFLRYLETNRDT